MAVADGFLRVMPGWEVDFWGHTLALDNFLPLLVGVLLFPAMGASPSWRHGSACTSWP